MEHLLDGPLGVDTLRPDDLRSARDQHRVVEHEQLRVEKRRQLASSSVGQASRDVNELFARTNAALFKARDFVVEPGCRHLIPQHLRPLNQNHRTA